ncbi:MAG TPA: RT0821/Lpp0805 family surface protein [Gammaproteobacteria bacterium]|nr:RT0821/Lpp0805 family surface protein [Gammaproteobacteria bacterium]
MMKQGLLAFIALLFSFNLIGCSSNTQEQNTTLGAITGAVVGGGAGAFVGQGVGTAVAVGVGIVGGALVGGYIGNHMDSSDNTKMNDALNNPIYKDTTWTNDKTGASYSMRPTSKLMAVKGNSSCRQFHVTANIDGKTQGTKGMACKQTDGSWQAIQA